MTLEGGLAYQIWFSYLFIKASFKKSDQKQTKKEERKHKSVMEFRVEQTKNIF